MRVRELLAKKSGATITVERGTDIGTIVHLLVHHHIGGVPVVSAAGEMVGFVSESDIVRAVDWATGSVHHMSAERHHASACDVHRRRLAA
jgi:CBS domain-containing protein